MLTSALPPPVDLYEYFEVLATLDDIIDDLLFEFFLKKLAQKKVFTLHWKSLLISPRKISENFLFSVGSLSK